MFAQGMMVTASSMPPAAPRPWPWIGLVEETGWCRRRAPKNPVDRRRFGLVVQHGASAMGIDIADVIESDISVLNGIAHGGRCASRSRRIMSLASLDVP